MSDRLLAVLKRLGFAPSWLGLVRVAAWLLVGLVALGAVLPDKSPDIGADAYNRRVPNPSVRNIATARGDPRGFTPTSSEDVFKVAWIGGSEIQEISETSYSFLPISVREKLPTVDGRPVSVDMYFVSGMRIADQYAAVLAAIGDDVDAIVVSLNPVWSTTDLAIQGWTTLNPLFATYTLPRPSAWPISLSLLAPSDLVWGEASRVSAAIDDRYQWGTEMQSTVDGWTLLPDTAPAAPLDPAAEAALPELDRIRAMTSPLEFWSTYAPVVEPDVTGSARTAASFDRYARSESGLNRLILQQMGDAITESGIPTLVYNAQVNYNILADPVVAPAVARVEATLAGEADSFASPNVTFHSETLSRRVPDMQFNDIVHVANFGVAPGLVASELCTLLQTSDHQPECEVP